MKRDIVVTIYMSHPDDGTENYDRDIKLEVRCTPGRPMHWPSPSCETGCPAEDAEFEIQSAIYDDDKSIVPESVIEKLKWSDIEYKAGEMAEDVREGMLEDRDDFRRDRELTR